MKKWIGFYMILFWIVCANNKMVSASSMSSIFTPYMDNLGAKYSDVLEAGYTDTQEELDEMREIHSVSKEVSEIPGTWQVSYTYYIGFENESNEHNIKDGILYDLSFWGVRDSITLNDMIDFIETMYGSYDLEYSQPEICSTVYFNQCYRWNSIEEGKYSMLLFETDDWLMIDFSNPCDEFNEGDILKPVINENEGFQRGQKDIVLNSYDTDSLREYANTDDNYENAISCLDEVLQSGIKITENVEEYTPLDDSLGLIIWTNELGKASQDFWGADSEIYLVKVRMQISYSEYSEDNEVIEDYIIVGKKNGEWKICTKPIILKFLEE